MSKGAKIRVENITFKESKFPLKYKSVRIKKDSEGNVIKTHGRPETEEIMEVRMNRVYKPYLLIEGEWYREKAAWHVFGRKKVVRAIKKYVDASKDRDELRRKLGKS